MNISLQVEKELSDICSSILQLLDDHLIPTASSGESKVFYLKMKGDYHRYLAEFKTGSDRKDAAEHTLLAYKAAQVGDSLSSMLSAVVFQGSFHCYGVVVTNATCCRTLPWLTWHPLTQSDWVWL